MKTLKIKYQIWAANRAVNKLAAKLTKGKKHFAPVVKL
jgi:hypothetical protein